jgi:hypothetical protein
MPPGGSVSGLRPPAPGGTGTGGLSLGGTRPLPGLSGMGGPATAEEPVEEATISIRRPTRKSPEADPAASAPPPPAPPAPARPQVPLAAWLPSDDDILPRGMMKRKGRGRR